MNFKRVRISDLSEYTDALPGENEALEGLTGTVVDSVGDAITVSLDRAPEGFDDVEFVELKWRNVVVTG